MARRIVKVTFLDHASADEVPLSEIQEAEPVTVIVYGEVAKETDSYLTVLTSYEKSRLPSGGQKGSAWTIIKSTILEVVELTPKC